MADDRELRDELEKVQGEVARLRRAFGQPENLHGEVRARIEALRRSRAQQQERLDEAQREVDRLEAEVRGVMTGNAQLQHELDGLLATERGLVGATVDHLDPGPMRRAGCLGVLAFAVGAVLAGACW